MRLQGAFRPAAGFRAVPVGRACSTPGILDIESRAAAASALGALRLLSFLLIAASTPANCPAQPKAENAALENWFDDPFFQVTRTDAGCPQPLGPLLDEQGRREQAHHRAERGTTCWLAGECSRPNAYAYDPAIAAAVRRAFDAAKKDAFDGSSLWVTVQGRIVYIEGCATSAMERQAEELVRSLPDVQQVITIVRTDPRSAVPYKVLPSR